MKKLTNKEMIATIKGNYPPSNYTMLRETLDNCIKLLTPPTADEIVKELNELYSSCNPKVKVNYSVIGRRFILYTETNWEKSIYMNNINRFNSEIDLPLELAHKITLFFMEEEK